MRHILRFLSAGTSPDAAFRLIREVISVPSDTADQTLERNTKPIHQADQKLDLSFSRIVDVPRALVWQAWTEPERLMPWFCPLPWKTIDCEIDLRPGGIFRTTMQSPEGQEFPNAGCYLEVIPQTRLSWANALRPSLRPCLSAAS